ncbi:MAG: hypothetical protein DMG01_16525 [Acidobacteria bacterium]|nr:MAG: hypothetical protein DMG01_16525 [Acidobacteriota bacterium]
MNCKLSIASSPRAASALLRDRVRPPVRVLFVGINPGIRSAQYESRLVPEPIETEDDARLCEWGFGITNLVPRATPGIDTLRPDEYVAGERALRRKVRRWKPSVVAFVGVTLFRVVFRKRSSEPIGLGLQADTFEGARVFVLPNPSGRNANFSYPEMLAAFRGLRTWLRKT